MDLPQPAACRVYVAQIRRKLEADPAGPGLLVTGPGVGYRLVVEENDHPTLVPIPGAQ